MYAERGMVFDKENFKKPVVIDKRKIKKIKKKHGVEAAEIYFQCVKDMMENIEGLFYQYDEKEDKYYVNTYPQFVFEDLRDFRENMKKMVKEVEGSKIFKTDDKATDSPQALPSPTPSE